MKHIVLAGPTASGKTELALALAQQWHTEIISADSRQLYTQLTIGTAKPQGQWQADDYVVENIPYHLVDFLSPDQKFDVFSFCQKSRELIDRCPDNPFIFAGGTGMYLHSFFIGIDALPPAHPALRAQLAAFAEQYGREALHAKLQQQDPVSAAQIPPQNIHRVIRALEITQVSGKPASQLKTGAFFCKQFPTEKALFVYLNWDKQLLQRRIEQRTAQMIEGMRQEIQMLLSQGFKADCPGLKSLGYPEVLQWMKGELTREQALEKIIIATRRYAKRQRTWFNRYTNVLRLDINTPHDFNVARILQKINDAYTR